MDVKIPKEEYSKEEYDSILDGYKFFVSIRFIVVAFAISIQSALSTIYNEAMKEKLQTEFSIFGVAILLLVATLAIEWRTTFIFRLLLKRGMELEFQLGISNGFFHQVNEASIVRGFRRFITHTWGINLVYLGIFFLWITLLVTTLIKNH